MHIGLTIPTTAIRRGVMRIAIISRCAIERRYNCNAIWKYAPRILRARRASPLQFDNQCVIEHCCLIRAQSITIRRGVVRIAIALRCVVIMLFLCRHFWSVCSFETVPRDLETSALRVYRVHFSPKYLVYRQEISSFLCRIVRLLCFRNMVHGGRWCGIALRREEALFDYENLNFFKWGGGELRVTRDVYSLSPTW